MGRPKKRKKQKKRRPEPRGPRAKGDQRHPTARWEAKVRTAKAWVAGFEGRRIVRAYRRRFRVDPARAVLELAFFGADIDPVLVEQAWADAGPHERRAIERLRAAAAAVPDWDRPAWEWPEQEWPEQEWLACLADPFDNEVAPPEPQVEPIIMDDPMDATRFDAWIDARALQLSEDLQQFLAKIRHRPEPLARRDVVTVDAFDVPCVVTWALGICGPHSLIFDELENAFLLGGLEEDGALEFDYAGSLAGALRRALDPHGRAGRRGRRRRQHA